MLFEIWYEYREPKKLASEWRVVVPVPRNAKEAGKAVEKIFELEAKSVILVVVRRCPNSKP